MSHTRRCYPLYANWQLGPCTNVHQAKDIDPMPGFSLARPHTFSAYRVMSRTVIYIYKHTRSSGAEFIVYIPGGGCGDGGDDGGGGGGGDGLGPRAMTDERDTSSNNSFSDMMLD